jgi:hypothetical protein
MILRDSWFCLPDKGRVRARVACGTEDGSAGKGTGRHIACFVLTPNAGDKAR